MRINNLFKFKIVGILLLAVFIVSKSFAQHKTNDLQTLKLHSADIYYNPITGYLLFQHDTLHIYTHDYQDSSQYYCAAKCLYQKLDSNHIRIQSLNSVKKDNEQIKFQLVSKRDTNTTQNMYINLPDTNREFEITLHLHSNKGLYKIRRITTSDGKATVNIENCIKAFSVTVMPIDYKYIPSNQYNAYYGRIFYNFPHLQIIEPDRDIKLTILGFNELFLKQYYIPEDYIHFSSDLKTLSWRGNYYFRL